MVLESTILCIDSSEYMRDGDFIPSRLQAQQDAVSLICHSKTRANPENNVGLITMATTPQVLTTLTADVGRILSKLHQVQPAGELNLVSGIRVAHLALKHRLGKNHKMRIVAFVGSPIDVDDKELVKLAKRLKKEKVNVDVINFGEEEHNTDKLTSFINSLNGRDGSGSHLVTVPPGPHLSDALISSPIIQGEDGSGAVAIGGSGFEFGIDPNEDPELALALRVSMEEQRQRQEEEARRVVEISAQSAEGTESGMKEERAGSSADSNTEEALLEKALAMSLENDKAQAGNGGGESSSSSASQAKSVPDFATMTEEEQIAYAMQMSLQQAHESTKKEETHRDENPEPMETDENDSKKEK